MHFPRLLPLLLPTLSLSIPTQPPLPSSPSDPLPTRFGLLLFPHFQALDVFGPLDVLNTLSMLYRNSTSMHLTVFSKDLNAVSTAMMGVPFGEEVLPTSTFAGYLAGVGGENGTEGKEGIEVLIVPGGGGTRQALTEEIDFVRRVYPSLSSILSICTGATLLSRAGILDQKRATTNKRSWAWATSTGPQVNWVPTARWVEDGNIFTSSGISAGIDAAYAWVARTYGEDVADYLALSSEYKREVHWDNDPWAKVWDVPGAK